MKRTLIDFLPQANEMLLTEPRFRSDILQFATNIVKHAITAIRKFYIQKDIKAFDPQVGDCACQIRAYQLIVMSKCKVDIIDIHVEIDNLFKLQDRIYGLKKNFDLHSNLRRAKSQKAIDDNETLEDLFTKNQINHEFNSQTAFLIEAYILTVCKDPLSGEISIDKTCSEFCISRYQARKFIHKLQASQSYESCSFIQEILNDLPDCKSRYIDVTQLIQFDDAGRTVIPQYTAMDIILNHMMLCKIPILLVIKRYTENTHIDTLKLLYKTYNGEFQLVKFGGHYHEEALVILGKSAIGKNYLDPIDYIKYFDSVGIKHIIMANMAMHPQYPGRKLDNLKENPYGIHLQEILMKDIDDKSYYSRVQTHISKFELYKDEAKRLGCCNLNSQLFLASHIYCAKISDVTNKSRQAHKFALLENQS